MDRVDISYVVMWSLLHWYLLAFSCKSSCRNVTGQADASDSSQRHNKPTILRCLFNYLHRLSYYVLTITTLEQSVTYRYREFPVPGIFIFWWYRNRYRKNLVPELIFVAKIFEFRRFIMGTGTGTGNFSFFLVVSEPVSEKFGTGKKSRNRYR